MKFDTLANSITEQSEYRVNTAGQQVLQTYHKLIADVGNTLQPLLEPYVEDPVSIQKELAVMVVSTINSNRQGNDQFEVMTRLDTLTNGGKSTVDPSTFAFNAQDPILQYLEDAQ